VPRRGAEVRHPQGELRQHPPEVSTVDT
jgi:hypothetical protein